MPTTDEIVEECKAGGWTRHMGYKYAFGVDEVHYGNNGDSWFIVSVFSTSLYNWLEQECEENFMKCGHAPPHRKWDGYPRYNVHQSIMMYIQLKWS